jgi:hypothetical protein
LFVNYPKSYRDSYLSSRGRPLEQPQIEEERSEDIETIEMRPQDTPNNNNNEENSYGGTEPETEGSCDMEQGIPKSPLNPSAL